MEAFKIKAGILKNKLLHLNIYQKTRLAKLLTNEFVLNVIWAIILPQEVKEICFH